MRFTDIFPAITIQEAALPLVQAALAEDCAAHDITTEATVKSSKQGEAQLIAKQKGVIAGLELVDLILAQFSEPARMQARCEDGSVVAPGELIFTLNGSLALILAAERTIVNYLQHLSGIATLSRSMHEALGSKRIQMLDTRKTLPGLRYLEKYAVACGGSGNHRVSLCDMYLIKENHIRAAGSLEQAIASCQEHRRQFRPSLEIEVEVTNLDEFRRAHQAGVDRILLDHFTEEMVFKAASLNRPEVPLELSGNVTLEKLQKIRDYPIHFVSSGALTHSAPALDLSMLIS